MKALASITSRTLLAGILALALATFTASFAYADSSSNHTHDDHSSSNHDSNWNHDSHHDDWHHGSRSNGWYGYHWVNNRWTRAFDWSSYCAWYVSTYGTAPTACYPYLTTLTTLATPVVVTPAL